MPWPPPWWAGARRGQTRRKKTLKLLHEFILSILHRLVNKIKILISFYQIATKVGETYLVTFPRSVERSLEVLSAVKEVALSGDELAKYRRGPGGAARLAEFGHDTQHGHLAAGRHGSKRLDRARNRQRIGVVGVVDDPGAGRRCLHRHPHR